MFNVSDGLRTIVSPHYDDATRLSCLRCIWTTLQTPNPGRRYTPFTRSLPLDRTGRNLVQVT